MSMRVSGDNHLWPNGIIPFEIDTVDFPEGSSGNNFIRAAMNEWNSKTNITFIPRREEADYVYFKMGDIELALDSPVGRQGGRQDINGASLGFTAASVIHEIGHSVGLFHEQGRQDRDAFVNVNVSNVMEGQEHNFIKEDGEQIGAYDYFSIMHYSRKLFPKDPLVDTVVPISWFGTESQAAGIDNRAYLRIGSNLTSDGKLLTWSNVIPVHNFGNNAIDIIGNRQFLSTLDIQAVNTMYPFKTVFGTPVRAGGWFGAETQGADVALADINGNGQQDMVIAFVDNPGDANKGYYRIGWNINAAGLVTNNFTAAKEIPGWWGNETAEVGVAIADISGNGQMDIIIMHIDKQWRRHRGGRYHRHGKTRPHRFLY